MLLGHAGHLYDRSAIAAMQFTLAGLHYHHRGGLPYLYPPFAAVLQAPLAALPVRVAYGLWMAVNGALLALCLRAGQMYARLHGRRAVLFWLAALAWLPVFVMLLQGKNTLVILAAMSASLALLMRGRDAAGGAVLSLVILKPYFAVPFLIVLLLRRRWTAVGGFLAAAGVLLALPLPISGPQMAGAYLHSLVQALHWRNEVGGYTPQANQGIAGFTALLLPSPLSSAVMYLLDAACLALLALHARRTDSLPLLFATAVLAGLLIAPHLLIHDLVLVLLPVPIALRFSANSGESSLRWVLLGGYVAVWAGFVLVHSVPLQLSTLALAAFGWWTLRATSSLRGARSHLYAGEAIRESAVS